MCVLGCAGHGHSLAGQQPFLGWGHAVALGLPGQPSSCWFMETGFSITVTFQTHSFSNLCPTCLSTCQRHAEERDRPILELQLADAMVLQMIFFVCSGRPCSRAWPQDQGPGSPGCRARPPCPGRGVRAHRAVTPSSNALHSRTGWLRALGGAEHHHISARSKSGYFCAYAQQWGGIRGWSLCPACAQQQAPGLAWGGNAASGIRWGGIEPCRQPSDTCVFLGSIGWSNILHRDNKSLSLLGLN